MSENLEKYIKWVILKLACCSTIFYYYSGRSHSYISENDSLLYKMINELGFDEGIKKVSQNWLNLENTQKCLKEFYNVRTSFSDSDDECDYEENMENLKYKTFKNFVNFVGLTSINNLDANSHDDFIDKFYEMKYTN